MDALMEIAACLPPETGRGLVELGRTRALVNVRLRAGQPLRAQWLGGDAPLGEALSQREIAQMASAMLQHSLYAWESELGQGFFTLPGGSRVGVAGKFARENGRVRLAAIGSLCVRVARAVPGCARALVEGLMTENGPASAVILAPPGAGKTTLLRDAARQLSARGYTVAIADERSEIAACAAGVPVFDVGERTDVIEGLEKPLAISRFLRAMAPDILVTDEIGGVRDGEALRDAARMGVRVLASAHAGSMDEALRRPALRAILEDGGFTRAFVLEAPGRISAVWRFERGWKRQTEGKDGV